MTYVKLRRSSGSAILDDAALTALKLAQPFPPLPDGLASDTLRINGAFRYQIRKNRRVRCPRSEAAAPGPRYRLYSPEVMIIVQGSQTIGSSIVHSPSRCRRPTRPPAQSPRPAARR